ncbi:polysaccharide deacetylase family protein [Thermodesulfobacteriota bacterium]
MPWKEGYTISDEKSMADKEIRWPDKQQCAVRIVVDYCVGAAGDGIGRKDIQSHVVQFGKRVGIRGLLDLFEKHNLRATFAVPAIIGETFPESIREAVKKGHEVAANGYLHEDVSKLDREEEKKRLDLTTGLLEEICGQRPMGWFCLPSRTDDYGCGKLSPHTIDLLIDAGYEYLGNGLADDIPFYWVTDFDTRRNILTLPYYYHFDDQFFISFPGYGMGNGNENPATLFQNWKQEFDASYLRGRFFSMFVHPYLIQWGHGMETLESMIEYIKGFPAVWNPTGIECARHWKETYPSSTYLNLKNNIWKDYPGSLS